jgi:hypothetical protein
MLLVNKVRCAASLELRADADEVRSLVQTVQALFQSASIKVTKSGCSQTVAAHEMVHCHVVVCTGLVSTVVDVPTQPWPSSS